jgi:predicted RNA binding protein YcfA (HicA-like mRNA interferase family)
MPKVPRISGAEVIRAFEKSGFRQERTKGSHCILKKDGNVYLLSVPIHKGKTVADGLDMANTIPRLFGNQS